MPAPTAVSVRSVPASARVLPLRGPRRGPTPVVAPALHLADSAAASVFALARRLGTVGRDVIAAGSGLSNATVNRQVSALLEADLLRERPDLVAAGAVGRPRVPVEVNHEPYLTLGLHVGARTTRIVAADLLGRILHAAETPTPAGAQAAALRALADSAQRYLSRWHRRRPLWVGVAVGGTVEGPSGVVGHPRLGWERAPVGPVLGDALGLPVSVASNVDAMAAAELLLTSRGGGPDAGTPAGGLYVYARETVGFAQVIHGCVHTPRGGPGSIAGLPVHSDLLGGDGRLESTVSDEAVVKASGARGLLPPAGTGRTVSDLVTLSRGEDSRAADARELLAERARVLGRAVGLLGDILNPDEIVVGGQAFTEYPEGLPQFRAAVAGGPERRLRVTGFGDRVQESGAAAVSLSGLYADPIGAVRRSRGRAPIRSA
jgi:predicted NBD/HSP70 family sugar kinase